jgi:ATP-dependent helicase/nuclease subunit A
VLSRALIDEGASIGCAAARARALAGDTRAGAWRSWGATPPATLTLAHWQALAQLALTVEGGWRVNVTRREGLSVEDPALKARALEWLRALARVEGARELLLEIRLLPGPCLPAEDAQALSALARLLRLAASELELVFQESGRVDFAYVAAAARRALTEESAPTDLALRLGDDLRHILVDEFQDTSIEQCALLEALTAAWEPGDGRTLFLVGDPMQSIYQFREAEVGLFLRVAGHGLGRLVLEPLALTRNFRAQPALVDWANRIFPRCFPQLDDPRTSAVSFRTSIAACEARGGGMHLHGIPADDPEAEARAIATVIVQLRASAPQSSTAILLSAKSHAAPIVASLRAVGVPVSGVDLAPLGEKSVVRDLASLARALDHLGDRTAWLAVLRAPWCGLTLKELAGLGEQRAHRTVWEWLERESGWRGLGAPARTRLARARDVLAQALRERAQLPLSQLIERAWLRLGGPAACRDDEDLEHAQAFFAALARWSSEPDWTGPLSLEERLEGLWASEAAASDAVQIMTIHRSKGLEFDHVIIPGLGRSLSSDSDPLLRWLELPRDARGSDLLMAAIAPVGQREPLSDYIKSLQERRAAHERARLLYVAVTRARAQVHLFAERPVASRGKAAAPAARTLLAALWPGIAAEFAAEPTQAAEPAHGSAASSRRRVPRERLAATWERPADWQDVRAESLPMRALEATEDLAGLREMAQPHAAAEDVVCAYLKRCARRSERPRAHAQLGTLLEEGLRRLGLEGAALEAALGQARTMLEACVSDERLQWIFSSDHARGEGALELTGSLAGELVHVRLDRTFVDAHGVRWAVSLHRVGAPPPAPVASSEEAKAPQMPLFGAEQTPKPVNEVRAGTGPPTDARIAAALERARRELAGYRALARALGPEPVRVGVYFPARCLWLEPQPPLQAASAQGVANTNS